MPSRIKIESTECIIQKLPTGEILVTHVGQQMNAMHGKDTGGEFSYRVHPCQRNQYDFLLSQLPPAERAELEAINASSERPWWSSGAGERAGMRE